MKNSLRTIVRSVRSKLTTPTPAEKCVFIHINKTGGSSIGVALGLKWEHKTAIEKIEEIGRKQWDKKLTFAWVRNPWDKVVSHYCYRVKTNQTNLAVNPIEFPDWVKLSYGEKNPEYYDKPKMFMPQSDWITDVSGEVLVDFVGRFENFERDFQKVCDRLKYKAKLPHKKKSERGEYQSYYDRESRKIIEKWFCEDIDRFGYKF
ncbi:MAG: sulfotransferase family 2 domain-containing protein [Geitlerinemataceae cyanobacterium]